MKEAIMSLWVILIYVMRRSGTLSMDEKLYILDLIGYISRRAGQGDGSTLLGEVTRYLPSPDVHSATPSQASRTLERSPHP